MKVSFILGLFDVTIIKSNNFFESICKWKESCFNPRTVFWQEYLKHL